MKSVYAAVNDLASSKNCFIALDRDGTLVPYTDRPEEARVTPELQKLVYDLAALPGVLVAIVSARSVAQLRGDFDYKNVILAGNYGVEILLPDSTMLLQEHAIEAVPILKAARDDLFVSTDHRSGVILEDHGYSLCLHWHRVPLTQRESLHHTVMAVADRYPELKIHRLPTSYEIFPKFHWDKGMALAAIDSLFAAIGRAYFFAGDTRADTPAFRWINEQSGISVRVGTPDLLGAQFNVSEPADLHSLLSYLQLQRSELSLCF